MLFTLVMLKTELLGCWGPGIVGLQAALMESEKVRGLLLINVSLRMLHIKKQQWYVRPFVKQLQNVLR
jgi:hypothetical protein